MKSVDALIVGAGPAGSAAAIALSRRGYEVALVERRLFPREKLCGDFINPVNRPILRNLGVERQLLAQPHETIGHFRITSCSGSAAEVRFAGGRRGAEPGLAVRRALFDHALSARAAEMGASVYHGQRIDRLRRENGEWRVSSAAENWRAKALIGADGRNSWVARQLGLGARIDFSGRAVGLQFRLSVPGTVEGGIEIHLIPGGYAGLVGLGDGTINLAMAVDKDCLPRRRDADFLCDRVLAANPHLRSILGRRAAASELRSVYPLHFPARRPFADGALLVGDAARVTEPVTGEGVYFALQSGLLAAESIHLTLQQGDRTKAALADYERACRVAFRSRAALNSLLRWAIYRPALAEPVIRLSSRRPFLLHSMISAVCMP